MHRIGCGAQTEDLRVETDGHVDVIVAGHEEEGIARRAEFTVLLNSVDLARSAAGLAWRGHEGTRRRTTLGRKSGACGAARKEQRAQEQEIQREIETIGCLSSLYGERSSRPFYAAWAIDSTIRWRRRRQGSHYPAQAKLGRGTPFSCRSNWGRPQGLKPIRYGHCTTEVAPDTSHSRQLFRSL